MGKQFALLQKITTENFDKWVLQKILVDSLMH